MLKVVTTHNDVLTSDIEGQRNPLKELAHNEHVLLYRLHIKIVQVPLQESNLLVSFELSLTLSNRVIVAHALEKLIVDQAFDFLEIKRVGITLTDFLTRVSKQIEKSLEHTLVLDNIEILQANNIGFELFRGSRVVFRNAG